MKYWLLNCVLCYACFSQPVQAKVNLQEYTLWLHEQSRKIDEAKPNLSTRVLQYFLPYYRTSVTEQRRKLNTYKEKTQYLEEMHQEYMDALPASHNQYEYLANIAYEVALNDMAHLKTYLRIRKLAESRTDLFLNPGQKYLGGEISQVGARKYGDEDVFVDDSGSYFSKWKDIEYHSDWVQKLHSSELITDMRLKIDDAGEENHRLSGLSSGGYVVSKFVSGSNRRYLGIRFFSKDLEIQALDRYLDSVVEDFNFSRAADLELLAESFDVFEAYVIAHFRLVMDVYRDKMAGLRSDYFHKVQYHLDLEQVQNIISKIKKCSTEDFPEISSRRKYVLDQIKSIDAV